MISTVRPSSASQIVRIGRPRDVHGVAPVRRRSTRPATASRRASTSGSRRSGAVISACSRACWQPCRHGPACADSSRHDAPDERLRPLRIGEQHPDDHVDRDGVVAGMPAIVVGDHRDGRVADLGFAGELGLGHVGHADHVAVPGPVELAFGKARELRSFHDHVGAAALQRDAGCGPGRGQRVADPAADRVRHRDMRDAARAEKALLPRKGAVDELVDHDKIAGSQILAQAADRRQARRCR